MLKKRRDREGSEIDSHAAIIEPPLGLALTDRTPIGELLVSEGVLQPGLLAATLAEQSGSGRRLGALLVEHGLISAEDLTFALSSQFGIPGIDVRLIDPSPEALSAIRESIARNLDIVPLELHNGVLKVAVADPLDERIPGVLRALPVDIVQVFLAPTDDVREVINSSYRALAGIGDFVSEFVPTSTTTRVASAEQTDGGAASPVVEIVNRLVTQALRDRASDIHLEPTDDRMRVRFRIDGALNEVLRLPGSIGPAIISRLKIMSDMNIVEKRRPQDGQFQTVVDGRELDVRVATTATIFGEKAVLRLLDKGRSMFDLIDLGMPEDLKVDYDRIVRSPFGMVVVAGPTGSGKTTTLYATLSQIARPELNVTTIEDPVEYVFPTINQIEINAQAGVTFATGLRSILRQDPDVILVGEVRDVETARIAVQSALTGHLVLSSLHATDAPSALYRLLDMGIERFLVASALTGVVAQRLLRRICTSCAEPYVPPIQELAYYDEGGGAEKDTFMRGAGCSYCSKTGYRGRIGIYEIMPITDELRYALVNNATPQEIREVAIKLGMRTLREEALNLVANDKTTIAEVMRTIYTL